MNAPDLSVIIVSWNVADHLERCLQALAGAVTPVYGWETLVVDNGSEDGTVGRVRSQFPTVRVIANKDNRLYTAAANQGLAAARGRHLLLLNPDAVAQAGSLAQLIRYADEHPQAGLLGPRIVDALGQDDLRTGRHLPTPWSETLTWSGLSRRFPRHRWLAANLRPDFDRGQTGPVPLLSGACLLLSEQLPTDLRLLDPGFPMYGEDVDLCRRLQARGFATVLVAEALVNHSGGESSRQDAALAALLAVDGVHRYFRRWLGQAAARRHRLGMAGVAVAKWLAFSLLGVVGREPDPGYQRRFHAELWRWAVGRPLPSRRRPAPPAATGSFSRGTEVQHRRSTPGAE